MKNQTLNSLSEYKKQFTDNKITLTIKELGNIFIEGMKRQSEISAYKFDSSKKLSDFTSLGFVEYMKKHHNIIILDVNEEE